MNLEQYVKENPTKTLAEIKVFSVPLDQVYNSNDMAIILAFNDLYLYFKNNTGEFQTAFYDRVKTQSNYDFRSNTQDGQILQGMLNVMIATEPHVTHKSNLENLKLTLQNGADGVLYPFADVIQSDIDSILTILNIQKQECIYSSGMSYIITTPSQGIDVDINTDTDIDCSFTAYLMVCADTNDQTDISNYSPINGDNPVTTPIKSINGKATIALSNRKVRGFNKLFIKPSKPCTFTAEAKANRG